MLKTLSASLDAAKRLLGRINTLKQPAAVAKSSSGDAPVGLVGVREMRSFTAAGDSGSVVIGDGQRLVLNGGTDITITVTAGVVSVAFTGSAGMASFTVEDAHAATDTITNGNTLKLLGDGGVDCVKTGTDEFTHRLTGKAAYVSVINSNTTLGTENVILTTNGGTITLTLPAAASHVGRVYMIRNAGSAAVTIGITGGDVVDGGLTSTLAVGYAVTFIAVQSGYWYSFV